MAEKRTFHYISADGAHEVAAYLYVPDAPPRGIIQLVHGMCEYIGRYDAFAQFLTDNGFVVCGNDLLGHGATAKSADELGFFGERDGVRNLVRDLHTMTHTVREAYPGLPLILYGHSMGSLLARCALPEYGGEFDGCVLSGTSGPNPLGGIGRLMCALEIRRLGQRGRSALLSRITFGGYNRKYPHPRTSADWITRDTAVVDRYIRDPLCTFTFTAAGFRDLVAMVNTVSAKGWAGSVPRDLPILLVSGEMDPVGGYGRGVREVARRLKDAGVRDVTLRLYPDARHEMHNELNKAEFGRDVLQWCGRVLEKHEAGQPAGV